MPFQFPVGIRTREIARAGVKIYYPQISGPHPAAEQAINRTIVDQVNALIREQGRYLTSANFQMIGHYEIKTNERGILSLILTNYAISVPSAHGMTLAKALTFDVNTGKQYALGDLFTPGSDYVTLLSDQIRLQIRERDIQTLEPFSAISPSQDYYLADKALIIFFQLYDITPYYYGFPMFPISVYSVQSITPDQSPLSTLSADIA